MGIEEFIERWSGREGGAERANYALFLTQLTQTLDLPTPEPADSGNDTYRFEMPVRGNTNQPLRIDLYRKGTFILEAKQSRLADNVNSKNEAIVQPDLWGDLPAPRSARPRRTWDADMRAAFNQAWDYAGRLPADHDRPPFIITCDVGRTFEFYADFSGQGRAYRAFPDERNRVVTLEQLADPTVRDLFHAVWTNPASLDPALKRAQVTREIASHLAEVSRSLEKKYPPEEVATFLTRTLFAMFAERMGLLPERSLIGLLEDSLDSPGGFAKQLEDLFRCMDEGDYSLGVKAQVRRFNGAFYKDRRTFPLGREEIGALLEAARKDWRDVEPAIFGTLLEEALTPGDRSRLGAHYTPRPYVERLVNATVMTPLRADWDAARAAAEDLRERGDKAGAALELMAFHDTLTKTRVLDPACGTGNFLYVTLELMKALESEVLEARAGLLGDETVDGLVTDDVLRGVDPRRFYGLELNPRAAAIAELVLWIGYLQASYRRDPNYRPRNPVLEDYATINPPASRRRPGDTCVDAVLMSDGPIVGGGGDAYPNPRLPPWPEAEFIVGNPPFTGGKFVRAEQGSAYAEALWRTHPKMDDASDLVMYWWDRAAGILTRKGTKLKRFGLVTTNSITQVFQRRTLARWMSVDNTNKQPLSLVFAVDDHPWTKATRDAAAVRIAMTVAVRGVREGDLSIVCREAALGTDQPDVELTTTVGVINPDLTVGVDTTRTVALQSNGGVSSPGVKLHGAGFIVSPSEARHLGLGRSDRSGLERHIRPYRNGRDITGRSRDKLVIDLYGQRAEHVRERYPEIYQYVAQTVKPERDVNNRGTYRENWWVFGEPRSELRPALADLSRYIVTPATSKHRVIEFLDGSILPDDALIVIASDDPAHLAALSSFTHTDWALSQGGSLEDRPRYNKSRCFDPFPFPAWTPAQHAALADAGERLDAFRKARLAELPDLTMTRLYNALEAHRAGKAPGHGMTDQEAADFDRASVLILAELHDEIDALTLDAYGWPRDLAGDALLERLVALNAERAAEEARGQIRWLRPLYQRPRAKTKTAGPEQAGDLVGAAPVVAPGAAKWPKERREQVLFLKGALSDGPLTAEFLVAQFKGRGAAADIRRLLGVLQRDGQVRRAPDGTYGLLRAA